VLERPVEPLQLLAGGVDSLQNWPLNASGVALCIVAVAVTGEAEVSVAKTAEVGVLLAALLRAVFLYQLRWTELSAGWLVLVLVSRGGGARAVYKLSVCWSEESCMKGVRTVWLTEGKEFEMSV
jgi:hypothetical protein